MVQKKIPSKLGIQAGYVKSDKHLAKFKPSPSQYQDGKNRTAEMKKMKSRSIQLSDLQGCRSSSSLRRNISQPGKPPPLQVTASATGSPQKQQPLIRAADGSPNYMKSTSSSNAKKELSLVSVQNTQSGSVRNKRWKNKLSDPTIDSVTKPARVLTKSSSSKKVRTLTKTPTFKLIRCQKLKTSAVAMSEDINLQKPTCSSTLKDSKFPEYLMLNPGGTEYEGTSVVKVCHYNYCSLNGHYHAPLPPLKSFLSAKRRALKTLKSFKLETRHPRRVKVTEDIKKASDIQQNSFDESPAYREVDVGCSNISSSTEDGDGMDFFIQIYAKDHEEEAIKTWSRGDEIGESDPAGELEDRHDTSFINEKQIVSVDGEEDIMQVVASVSDGSPKSEIDLEEDFAQKHVDIEAETETKAHFLFEDETTGEGEGWRDNTAEGSQATDMEWEEGYFNFIKTSYEDNIPNPNGKNHDSNFGCSLEVYSPGSHDEHTSLTEDLNSIDNKENMGSVSVQEACLEGVGAQFDGEDVKPEGLILKMQPVTYEEAKSFTFDQLSLSEFSFHDLLDSEDKREVITLASNLAQETTREFKEGNDESPKDEVQMPGNIVRHINGMECDRTQALDQVLNDKQDRKRLEDNGPVKCLNDSMSNSSHPLEEFGQVKSEEEDRNETFEAPEEFQSAASDTSIEEEELQDINAGDEAKKEDSPESEVCSVGIRNHAESDIAESAAGVDNIVSADTKNTLFQARTAANQEVSDIFCNWKQLRKFNPRASNYLSLVPDPETEKVDLKHQETDERKNAAEWMIDYALQRAVTKLASARKRKVALLVEAFETVNPIPTYDSHLRNTSAFTHHRLMQTCS